jgi:hypothetical protein
MKRQIIRNGQKEEKGKKNISYERRQHQKEQ